MTEVPAPPRQLDVSLGLEALRPPRDASVLISDALHLAQKSRPLDFHYRHSSKPWGKPFQSNVVGLSAEGREVYLGRRIKPGGKIEYGLLDGADLVDAAGNLREEHIAGEGNETVYRYLDGVKELLGERAVHDAASILWRIARDKNVLKLETNIIQEAAQLNLASFSHRNKEDKSAVVYVPDGDKMIRVITDKPLPEDIEGRETLLSQVRTWIADPRVQGRMKHLKLQAIDIKQERNVFTIGHSDDLRSSGTKIRLESREVAPKYEPILPKQGVQKKDELVVLLPGWSMPYDGTRIKALGHEYADAKGAKTIIATARVDSVVEDDLFLRAQEFADYIISQGVKKVTLTAHSQGSPQAADVAWILQTKRAEQIAQGINPPTIPEVEGIIFHDPVGLYDQDPKWLAINFAVDSGMTVGPALGMQVKHEHAKFARRNAAEWDGDEQQMVKDPDRPIMHNAGQGAVGKVLRAGWEIVKGAWQERKDSGPEFLDRSINDIKGMATVPADRIKRFAELEVPIVIITGEQDLISRPEKFVPEYKKHTWENAMVPDPITGELYDARERHLQETTFPNAPFVRMVTVKHGGRHGQPLVRERSNAQGGLALIERAHHTELRSERALKEYNA